MPAPEAPGSYVHLVESREGRVADIILHCVRQAQEGGQSVLAPLGELLAKLSPGTVTRLQRADFPSRAGLAAVLMTSGGGSLSIRYKRTEIERCSRHLDLALTAEQRAALDQLDDAIERSRHHLKLMPNECMVIDNRTVLHGRTAFPSQSLRLLRRVKVRR